MTTSSPLAVGERLAALITAAYRLRKPLLIEGPSGIGKSEIVQAVARRLAIDCTVLDLSLLEPPDLIGLPIIANGRTDYAIPQIMPVAGAGLLMLEELNRAELYVQQPALQLLSARSLHNYRLPEAWSMVAAVNPDTEGFNVRPLDRALVDRFLQVAVTADRDQWLSWAMGHGVHPAVLNVVRQHPAALRDVSPRRWVAVSAFLHDSAIGGLDEQTLQDALRGYLPDPWMVIVCDQRLACRPGDTLNARAALVNYANDEQLRSALAEAKKTGRTDIIHTLVVEIEALLSSTSPQPLAANYQLELSCFEKLLGDLPRDDSERLQYCFGENSANCRWLAIKRSEVNALHISEALLEQTRAWLREPRTSYRGWAVLSALLDAHCEVSANEQALSADVLRRMLRGLFAALGEVHGRRFRTTAKRLGVLPGYKP